MTATASGENGSAIVYRVGASLVETASGIAIRDYDFDAVAFAPDGKTLAAGSDGGSVELFDTFAGHDRARPRRSAWARPVGVVAFNPSGTLLATGDYSGAVRLWNPGTDAQIGETMEDGSPVHGVAFAPDGLSLCSAGGDGALFVWDSSGLTPRRADHLGRRPDPCSSPSAATATSSSRSATRAASPPPGTPRTGGVIGRRTPASPTSIATTPDSDGARATAAAVDRHGDEVALGLANGDVLLENPRSSTMLGLLPESDSPAGTPATSCRSSTLAFSADGRFLAVGLASGQMSLWTRRPGQAASRTTSSVSTQAFNPGITGARVQPCRDRARRVHRDAARS